MVLVRSTIPSLVLVSVFLSCRLASSPPSGSSCKGWLVQSIPTDMPDLRRVPGVLSTGEVLRWLAGNASERLDVIAQYWQLLEGSGNPNSGDYGYSEEEMRKFGADEGRSVYEALEAAADRKVEIRIVQHSGFYPEFDQESSNLASGRPNVHNVTLLFEDWWGSGVVHAKVWISDGKDVYIGSANNDWKSLTQVKELGIYLVNCSSVAKQVKVYFENLLKLASLNTSVHTRTVWDKEWQVYRKVPCWSHFIRRKERCRSPLPGYVDVHHVYGYPSLSDPFMFQLSIETPGYKKSTHNHHPSYLSFAPPELLFGKFQADGQGWVETIMSVQPGGTVRMNTMDWLGQSEYLKQTVYWSSLSSAISEVVFSQNATVKILVAYWDHFIENTVHYLKSLLYSNILCKSSKYNSCSGNIKIRYYKVPGFESTGPAMKDGKTTGNKYPDFTRVNHGKYAVSDTRAHIGTSNLIWDYFYTTAGVSFGTYNPSMVAQLQEIFDSDWNSPFAVPVEPLQSFQI